MQGRGLVWSPGEIIGQAVRSGMPREVDGGLSLRVKDLVALGPGEEGGRVDMLVARVVELRRFLRPSVLLPVDHLLSHLPVPKLYLLNSLTRGVSVFWRAQAARVRLLNERKRLP